MDNGLACVNVAQVGAYRRFSQEDKSRLCYCLEKFDLNKIKNDIINLKYGRDFLKERFQYDIVILHSILDVNLPKMYGNKLLTSNKHNINSWKKRLISTKAKYIFVCQGQPFSLNIGELTGYCILQDGVVTIYEKRFLWNWNMVSE